MLEGCSLNFWGANGVESDIVVTMTQVPQLLKANTTVETFFSLIYNALNVQCCGWNNMKLKGARRFEQTRLAVPRDNVIPALNPMDLETTSPGGIPSSSFH